MSVRRGPLFTFNYSGRGGVSIRTVPAPGPDRGFSRSGVAVESHALPRPPTPLVQASLAQRLPRFLLCFCHCPSEIRRYAWNLSIAEDVNSCILMKGLSRLYILNSTRLSTAPMVTSDADCWWLVSRGRMIKSGFFYICKDSSCSLARKAATAWYCVRLCNNAMNIYYLKKKYIKRASHKTPPFFCQIAKPVWCKRTPGYITKLPNNQPRRRTRTRESNYRVRISEAFSSKKRARAKRR